MLLWLLVIISVLVGGALLLYLYWMQKVLRQEYQFLLSCRRTQLPEWWHQRVHHYNQMVDHYHALLYRLRLLMVDRLFKPQPYIY